MSENRSRMLRVLRRVGDPASARPDPDQATHPEHPNPDTGRLVVGVALVCVAAQVAVRGWALYGGWFYFDDYILLADAEDRGISWSYLLTAGAGHVSPGGRLLMSWTAAAGTLSWGLAATATLTVQALAGLAATWALMMLFGRRWAVLVPLNLYLWSAITVPAMMWLSGAILLVPQQLSFWVAVGAWVQYLRARSTRWLLLTVVGVGFGLAFDVKAILTVAVLGFLTLAYFSAGGPRERIAGAIARYWLSAAVVGAAAAGYLGFYLTRGGPPMRLGRLSGVGDLASAMLGTAFASAAVGGPWRWSTVNAPAVYADPPVWAQHVSWVVLAAVVAAGWLLRVRTFRAWVLLGGYLAVLLALVATSRGLDFGDVVGGELRYVTDAAMVLALCVGLAFLPVLDATESSKERNAPKLLLDLRVPVVVLVSLVCVGSLTSTLRYVHVWHTQNASEQWLANLRNDVRAVGPVDLLNGTLPANVQSPLLAPRNRVADLARFISADLKFPQASPALRIVGNDGRLRRADIELGLTSQAGPRPGCGWLVRERGKDVPLTSLAFSWSWWLKISYLAGQSSPVTVVAGDSRVRTTVLVGLNNLYVRVDGSFSAVRIEGLDPGASMCVDSIEAGQPVAGQVVVG